MSLHEVIQSLKEILNEPDSKIREKLVRNFNEYIFNADLNYSAFINDTLLNLATDIDFYEPNPEWRKEDPSYFGDEKLEQKINEALEKIESFQKI